ncbi:OLC1v1013487C1 [Oldenlandia corymbosa var. corymbosa]|uniref:OLC1v1013487C1 n=1 Tax=Oldenlandia corymbosa var. corymbosa TaxID=529605 RepID=A0AAV1E0X3_OLDCO|nr:OLC1v1013487C1 [Oldenlandia corymbosa var. corymbosa]
MQNLKNFQVMVRDTSRALCDALKPLVEQMMFLENLILFVIFRFIELNMDFVGSCWAVAIDAAFLLFDDGVCKTRAIVTHLSLLQNMYFDMNCMKVYKIYTEALNSSKLAAELLSPTDHQGLFIFSFQQKHLEKAAMMNQLQRRAQTIQEGLISLRFFLESTVELPNDQEKLLTLRGQVSEVAYRVEDLIEYLMIGNLPDFVSEIVCSVMKDITNINSEIEVMKKPKIICRKVTTAHTQVQSALLPAMTKEIVGFQDQAKLIIDRLERGSRNLRIVAIVGMPGLGKTTLAEKVCNAPSVLYRFSVRAFTTVSQTFDKKGVLIDLLRQVDSGKCSQITAGTSAEDAAEMLRRSLKGN